MSAKSHVLVIDDEADIRELLGMTLKRMGLETHCVASTAEAFALLAKNSYDLCLTDMRLPDGDGLGVVDHVSKHHPSLPVAVITAHGSTENAVAALKAGAFDYLAKPVSLDQLRSLVRTALKLPQPAQRRAPGEEAAAAPGQALLIGASAPMQAVRAMIDRLARTQAPIHITGESGSGKELAARIQSYELAYRMQSAAPEAVDLSQETAATQAMYGIGQQPTDEYGRNCLIARRLVERGVRFVQVFHGSSGGAGAWDAHSDLKNGHTRLCKEVDQPIAALIGDLKQRGLLDETSVVIGTEFGRTPGAERSNGRDHHPYGFSVALAGGGIRGGIAHGATDELGFHAVEHRHYVTDLHATVLHQLGLDPRKLEVPGRKRLEIDFGEPIREILACQH